MNEKKRTKTENKTGQRASVHVGLYNDGFLFQCCHLLCVGLLAVLQQTERGKLPQTAKNILKLMIFVFLFQFKHLATP